MESLNLKSVTQHEVAVLFPSVDEEYISSIFRGRKMLNALDVLSLVRESSRSGEFPPKEMMALVFLAELVPSDVERDFRISLATEASGLLNGVPKTTAESAIKCFRLGKELDQVSSLSSLLRISIKVQNMSQFYSISAILEALNKHSDRSGYSFSLCSLISLSYAWVRINIPASLPMSQWSAAMDLFFRNKVEELVKLLSPEDK
jgi:hypothetical protein